MHVRKLAKGAKKFVAAFLAATLVFNCVPTQAIAAVINNNPAVNEEILGELKELVGSEDEAQTYYELLQQYNLLDEDGNMVESWEIRMDGEDITLDELREILAGDYDAEHYITVDGTPMTLGDVATAIQIEDYISYLRETYYSGTEWTTEQQASLASLMDQIDEEGIQLLSADDESLLGESGVNHAARVSISGPEVLGTTATFTATLSNPGSDGVKTTFSYAALSGSQTATGSGTVTLSADSDTATFTVELTEMTTETTRTRNSNGLVWYLKLDNISNALFDDGDAGADAMTAKYTTENDNTNFGDISDYGRTWGGTGEVTTSTSLGVTTYTYSPYVVTFKDDAEKQQFIDAIAWGFVDSVTIHMGADASTLDAYDLSEGSKNLGAYVPDSDGAEETIPTTFQSAIAQLSEDGTAAPCSNFTRFLGAQTSKARLCRRAPPRLTTAGARILPSKASRHRRRPRIFSPIRRATARTPFASTHLTQPS